MPNSEALTSDKNRTELNDDAVLGIIREFFRASFHLAVLLISAGKIDWINAWVCFGLALSYQLANSALLAKVNPQLLNKRGRLVQKNTKLFDRVFIAFYLPLALLTSIIAGLDAVRYEWSHMSLEIIIFGIVIYIISCIFGSWAMAVNPHFETTVLIQKDQKVCKSGPYKIVRHPGYLAGIIGSFSYVLILGSWWGLVPAAGLGFLFGVRTAFEDRTLQEELSGYKEYTKNTRYRLIPFLW